jgi:hypothetical protein
MSLHRLTLAVLTATVTASLTACGTSSAGLTSARVIAPSQSQVMGVPPQSAFTTLQGTVVKVLPEDNHGLPHQNFVIKDTKGRTMAVNNDTKFGSKVKGLVVGMTLTIRGVEYHDAKADGIHWTHHANKKGDAGFIQTPDGTKYE